MKIYYTKTDEYAIVDGDVATVGITNYASEHLGDIIFVDKVAAGKKVKKEGNTTAIESVNAGLAKIWSEGGSIYVSTPAATNLTVVSAIGRMIRMSAVPAGTTTIGNLSSGIYFVRFGNETRKIAVK